MDVISKGYVADRIYNYATLMRLKTSLVVLRYVCPSLYALWLAGKGRPDPLIVVIFIVGAIVMRSAGCVINDYIDRNIDSKVARTRNRPLVTGKVSTREALILFAFLCFCAFLLVAFLNTLTIILAFVGLGLTILYPFCKRFFFSPELVVSFAICWGVVLAFAAQAGSVPLLAWRVFAATVLLMISEATIYAIADRDEDLMIGLKSTAIFLKHYDRLVIGLLQFSGAFLLIYIGYKESLNYFYYIALGFAVGSLLYGQYLIKDYEAEKCIRAWKNYSWFWLIILIGVLIGYE